ncbi:S-adenosylmethionine-dependent methyltransferase-like protein [Parachaetomium inaequale]|uniref:40S ribosomal protein S24 n=1 Tax=Parachaetomium inaequale TaxID=2588326 RepID=A0AAN6SLK2_9PEZI|nr:S-adenosylmethionine-dependent methyltransferase-like protein [Parachaetomium inaequale]
MQSWVDSQISRFCWQNLQVDPTPVFPDAELLRDELAQETIYERVFSDDVPLRPPRRYQVRILKELIARIESSVQDWDQHGISDNLTLALSNLLSQPLPSETDAAQQRDYVVYHLSLLQAPSAAPNLPHINLLESRSLISASGTTGLRTWEAALHLGQYLCADPSLVQNKRVLELGTGTGYLAVLCAKYLGSDHVMASDGSDEVVNHMSDSIFLNGLQGSPKVAAMQLKWGHALVGTELEGALERLDTVLGADITYDVSVIPALVATLEDLARLFPGVSVLIAATERNRATFESFLDRENPTETSGYRDRGSIANIDRHPTAKMADSDSPVTLRTRKFIRNPLLGRKQMVVDILHPNRANISKEELRDKLAGMYKAQKDQVSVFGLRTQFGGGKTTGFALVYDSPEAMKKFEPHYRLVRVGLATKIEKASRQQRKQRKNRQKTLRGTAKVKGPKAKKEK